LRKIWINRSPCYLVFCHNDKQLNMNDLFIVLCVSYGLMFVCFLLNFFAESNHFVKRAASILFYALLFIHAIYFFGYRDISIGTDTENYVNNILPAIRLSDSLFDYNLYSAEKMEPAFYYLTKLFSFFYDYRPYLVGISLIFVTGFMLAFYRHYNFDDAVPFLFFLGSSFFFHSLGVNIIRNGLSLASVFLMLHYLSQRRWVYATLFALLSIGFHISALLFLAILLGAYFFKNIYFYYAFYFFSIVLAFFEFDISNFLASINIGEGILQTKLSSQAAKLSDEGYQTGFRLDFVIYCTAYLFPIWVYKRMYGFRDATYNLIERLYLTYTAIFYLYFQIPFSNRIGLYGWMLIPLLLFYPLIKQNLGIVARIFAVAFAIFNIIVTVILLSKLYV
jgi:hypothetical protein